MIKRLLEEKITKDFNKDKIIVILGPRQVGKTTLIDSLQKQFKHSMRLNCDDYDDALAIQDKTSTELRELLNGYDAVFIDEAQRVHDIGLTLKKIGDLKLHDTQIIVTGSSSLELASGINEPATGRLWEYRLYPLSMSELAQESSIHEQQRLLPQRLVYGLYPEVVTAPDVAKRTLMTLTESYLYKDLLSYKGIRKPEIIQKLVLALALQIGSEVSYNELSNLLGIDRETVENYIDLLEKCYVIFRLNSFSGNLRTEIKKGKKIYFYDNGIRNAIISNFAPLEKRTDNGALWENFVISERVKHNAYSESYARLYFWRTQTQSEVDLIEIEDGQMSAYEFKWNTKKKPKVPSSFSNTYPDTQYNVITPDNFWTFV